MCAAECRDGFPDHGSYQEVLSSGRSPEALLAEIAARARTVPDQWQVQVQAKIQAQARVVVYSDYLRRRPGGRAPRPDRRRRRAVREALAAAGPDARVCVLPEGPQTIPYVA